jgi:multidrug efflux pump subunit AcrA (membrane-fusion protein)
MTGQPPPSEPRHQLSREQELMRDLRAAKAGGAPSVSTDDMYELADIHTSLIARLQGALAQAQLELEYANARVGFHRTIAEGEEATARQVEKATPPPHSTEKESES